jgi:hypothetical protein
MTGPAISPLEGVEFRFTREGSEGVNPGKKGNIHAKERPKKLLSLIFVIWVGEP